MELMRIPRQKIRWQRSQKRLPMALLMAYGSCLSIDRMADRCPDAIPVEPILAPHMALVFRGVADISSRPNRITPAGLWRVSLEDERAMDRFEGVANQFYIKRYFTLAGEDVLFYQMKMTRGVMPPSETYIGFIEKGYRDFGLDLAYLDQALADSWNEKEVTPHLRQRHIDKGRPQLARA